MKLQHFLKQRKQIKPALKHVCKSQGLLIARGEKELILEGLQGIRRVIVDQLKEYEEKEMTFSGFQRIQKEYAYLQLQLKTIDTLEKKL